MDAKFNRITSFIVGGLVAAVSIGIGILRTINMSDITNLYVSIAIGILLFTYMSCMILENNIVKHVLTDVLHWCFVRMPTAVFRLNLKGIIWLLTVKLLLWIINYAFAILCAVVCFIIASVVSVFVYPFALVKNIRHPEMD